MVELIISMIITITALLFIFAIQTKKYKKINQRLINNKFSEINQRYMNIFNDEFTQKMINKHKQYNSEGIPFANRTAIAKKEDFKVKVEKLPTNKMICQFAGFNIYSDYSPPKGKYYGI